MPTCKHVRYSGKVQGVGFRYTAQQLAAGYPVSGYVRNLPDGDVELVAEGTAEGVEAFLAALAQRMAGYVEHADVRDGPPAGHHGFRIRH
jgi:acylphosphatase